MLLALCTARLDRHAWGLRGCCVGFKSQHHRQLQKVRRMRLISRGDYCAELQTRMRSWLVPYHPKTSGVPVRKLDNHCRKGHRSCFAALHSARTTESGRFSCSSRNLVRAAKMGGESVGIMANILSGAFWPCVPAHGLPVVDVEDVVAAHSLAAVSPKARGRCVRFGWPQVVVSQDPVTNG